MLLSDTFQTAFKGLTVNTTRAALTMLGIIIGVASVILMVSLGNSFQNYILVQIESIGTNTMDIYPKGFEKFGGNLDSLVYEDYVAISHLSTIERSTPVVIVGKPIHGEEKDLTPMIIGAYDVVFGNYGLKLGQGRLLDQSDENGAKNVVVIGDQTREDLFGNQDPINQKVTIGEQTFTVVGTLLPLGSALLSDLDEAVFMPFSTARSVTGLKHLSYITLKTTADPELATQDITSILRDRHRIKNPENDPDKDDFIARGAEQITSIVGTVTLGLTVFLSLIAGISLLVGGIGIMNIMLVSVTERTREIGLRKAVGARRRDILLQFLLEAIFLTLAGGLIGIFLGAFIGWVLTLIVAKFLGTFTFVLSFTAILLSVSMAIGTGLLFGIYPARQAARLSPMQALLHE